MLELENLQKEYRRGNHSFAAVEEITLTVGKGEFAAVTGRSGSGKSTLLGMVAGLIAPTKGSIRIDGRDIGRMDDADLSRFRNRAIGYISQGATLISSLTVFDNVRLPLCLAGPQEPISDDGGRVTELLTQLEITHLVEMYPKNLSGGEMRRVSIARALVNRPRLLLADEPTGDLDEETTRVVMELFADLAQNGTAILMVTHDPEVLHYTGRRYRMKQGRIEEIQ